MHSAGVGTSGRWVDMDMGYLAGPTTGRAWQDRHDEMMRMIMD